MYKTWRKQYKKYPYTPHLDETVNQVYHTFFLRWHIPWNLFQLKHQKRCGTCLTWLCWLRHCFSSCGGRQVLQQPTTSTWDSCQGRGGAALFSCGQLFWVMCQTLITYFTILDVKENPATSEQRLFCRVKICIPHSTFINNSGWIYSWSLNDLGWSADCQSPHRKNLSMTFDCPKTWLLIAYCLMKPWWKQKVN